MKWSVDNLFENQFIRPKKPFRDCFVKNCKSKRKFYIKEYITKDGNTYKSIVLHCSNDKCYDPKDDWRGDTLPSYMIDFDLLQILYNEREKFTDKDIKYYIKLKQSIAKNPYFKHLKRVANRKKLHKKRRGK